MLSCAPLPKKTPHQPTLKKIRPKNAQTKKPKQKMSSLKNYLKKGSFVLTSQSI